MSRIYGRSEDAREGAEERRSVLEALDGEALAGPEVFRRMRERSTGSDARTGMGHGVAPDDESLLYPALHSLEASWKVQAAWLSDAAGKRRRIYRKRRLLSGRLGEVRPR